MEEKILVTLIFTLFLFGCIDGTEGDESFKIENDSSQQVLVERLREKQIPFSLSNNGHVWFSLENKKTVHEIAFQIMNEFPDKDTFKYEDEKYTNLLIKKLEAARAPYSTTKKNGDIYIVVEYKNEAKWRPVIKEVDGILNQDMRRKLGWPE